MFYNITGLCPRRDNKGLGGYGFNIQLFKPYKVLVEKSGIDQTAANNAIKSLGRNWLDSCGFDKKFDGDFLYKPESSLRMKWGEWGPEHITVPGNACGLDLDTGIGRPPGGVLLTPHNVDTIYQAHLLLVIFTWFSETLVLYEMNNNKAEDWNDGIGR